jgi:hypothetical protein
MWVPASVDLPPEDYMRLLLQLSSEESLQQFADQF